MHRVSKRNAIQPHMIKVLCEAWQARSASRSSGALFCLIFASAVIGGVRFATARMMIVNPLHGGSVASLFSTHPTTGDRVARLCALAAEYR